MVVVPQLIGHRWMAVGLVAISVGLVTVWLGRRCRDLAKVLVGHLFLGVGDLEEALPGTIHLSIGQRDAEAVEAVVECIAARTRRGGDTRGARAHRFRLHEFPGYAVPPGARPGRDFR